MELNVKKHFDNLGVMVDCSRNSVMTVETVKKLIDLLSSLGYNTLQLYTEDTYEVDGEPYFGYMRGRYTQVELKEIDAYALSKGVELIPCIQTLAHLKKIFRWQPYWGINDVDDILLADDPRTEQLIENIFKTLDKCFTSRKVNLGMDEAHLLGLGNYLKKYGYTDRSQLMIKHLNKVLEIAGRYGFKCSMWSDMFFRLAFGDYYADGEMKISPEVKDKIPDVELIYWDYYSADEAHYDAMIKNHFMIKDEIAFAGGGWTWNGITPMNRFGLKVTRAAFNSCVRNGLRSAFITLWGDDGGTCSPFSVLPVLYSAAAYASGIFDEEEIKKGFEERFNIPYDVFMYADLPNIITDDQPVDATNASKYLLYNDAFMGIYDSCIQSGVGERFASHAAKLDSACEYKEWAFVFKPLAALCRALQVKAELGLKTREAYDAKDKKAIKELTEKGYKPAISAISALYRELNDYWMSLYKPHGFDVIDYRMGGLIHRLSHLSAVLEDYASGKTDRIPELDEKLLDYLGKEEDMGRKPIGYNGFSTSVTVNSL